MAERPLSRNKANALGLTSPFADAFSRRPAEFQNAAIANSKPQTRAARNAQPTTAGSDQGQDGPDEVASTEPVNPDPIDSSTTAPKMILPSQQALVLQEQKLTQKLRSLSAHSAQGLITADQFKSEVRRERNAFAEFSKGTPAV